MANTLTRVDPAAASAATAAGTAATTTAKADQLTNKEVFLELLVAQIKNQNPLSPSDPKDFLTQLSQFSGVEQMVTMRQELEAIHQILTEQQAAAATQAATGNS